MLSFDLLQLVHGYCLFDGPSHKLRQIESSIFHCPASCRAGYFTVCPIITWARFLSWRRPLSRRYFLEDDERYSAVQVSPEANGVSALRSAYAAYHQTALRTLVS